VSVPEHAVDQAREVIGGAQSKLGRVPAAGLPRFGSSGLVPGSALALQSFHMFLDGLVTFPDAPLIVSIQIALLPEHE